MRFVVWSKILMLLHALCMCSTQQVFCELQIVLNATNHVALHGPITDLSTKEFLVHAARLHNDHSDASPKYVYINSPGGSVVAGSRIVRHVMSKNYTCIADHAISMAFVVFQACTTRIVMAHSILMQHQQSLYIDGNLENVKSYMRMINAVNDDLTLLQAERLKMTVKDFKEKTVSDWWLYGKDILTYRAADKLISSVDCDIDLLHREVTRKEDTGLFGIEVNVTYSACPIVNI